MNLPVRWLRAFASMIDSLQAEESLLRIRENLMVNAKPESVRRTLRELRRVAESPQSTIRLPRQQYEGALADIGIQLVKETEND